MAHKDLDPYVQSLLAACEARQHERDLKKGARSARWLAVLEQRAAKATARDVVRKLKERPCCAKTRSGTSCKRRGLGRGGRCANHGGLSTGPRTLEGRQRIAEAQRKRWAEVESEHGQTLRDRLKSQKAMFPQTANERP
jgi:hypothetical protein